MPHWRSRWKWLLALGAFWLSALAGPALRAEDDAEPPPGQTRAIMIGQSVLVVDQAGVAIMYDDPTGEEQSCAEIDMLSCWRFPAAAGAALLISDRGDVVQVVDQASGTVFEDTTTEPP